MVSFTSCLNEDIQPIALDASVVVNLHATGRAERIIQSIPNPISVTPHVLEELELGENLGYSNARQLKSLISCGLVEMAELSEAANMTYLSLVTGGTADTLDDGEAATVAFAYDTSAWAAIDERKALRICSERFQSVRTTSTIDLLAHRDVRSALAGAALSDAVFSALNNARMRVLPHQVDWVVHLIGVERANQCSSLPRRFRLDGRISRVVEN